MARHRVGGSDRLSVDHACTRRSPRSTRWSIAGRCTRRSRCRMWARSALYQSSGAYGFRDQLQDVMAFVYAEPAVAREHILRAAGAPVRRRRRAALVASARAAAACARASRTIWRGCRYVVDHYVRVTGDAAVLDEAVPFLDMRAARARRARDLRPAAARQRRSGDLVRALPCARCDRPARTGEHGLPLIGTGDWNDGMNRVGIEGRGESVWLAWFLIATLAPLRRSASSAAIATRAATLPRTRRRVRDGGGSAWLGRRVVSARLLRRRHAARLSARATSASIDSIAQSWSVISGAGDARTRRQPRCARSRSTSCARMRA